MKRGPFLVDTGFVIALVRPDDSNHAASVNAWREVQGPFFTTEGALVEAAWLLRHAPGALGAAYAILHGAGARFVAPAPWRYSRALELMQTYRSVPMDLVDAVLVALSEELDCRDVLTVDVRGFSTYRSRGKPFRRLP